MCDFNVSVMSLDFSLHKISLKQAGWDWCLNTCHIAVTNCEQRQPQVPKYIWGYATAPLNWSKFFCEQYISANSDVPQMVKVREHAQQEFLSASWNKRWIHHVVLLYSWKKKEKKIIILTGKLVLKYRDLIQV